MMCRCRKTIHLLNIVRLRVGASSLQYFPVLVGTRVYPTVLYFRSHDASLLVFIPCTERDRELYGHACALFFFFPPSTNRSCTP